MMWHILYMQMLICLSIICRALHELLNYVLPCPTPSWRDEKRLSLPSSKLTISLYSIYKHDAIDIADPNSMQDGYHELRNRPRSLESLWLSGRASECRILRSEVRFLMGTQNFFLCPTLVTRQKTSLSISLPSSKLTISLILLCTATCKCYWPIGVRCLTRKIWP